MGRLDDDPDFATNPFNRGVFRVLVNELSGQGGDNGGPKGTE
jgi:hypothetical protein